MRRVRAVRRRLEGIPQISRGSFDVAHLPAMLETESPVILEIGCNDGSDTQRFLQLFSDPRVYCFEPDPRAQRGFRRNINDPRVTLFGIALGNQEGLVDFHASDGSPDDPLTPERNEGWDLSGSIRKPKNHLTVNPWCRFDKVIQVPIKSLDKWAHEHDVSHVDFIWADVQGAEVDLIRGGAGTLARTRFFYTEYNDNEMYDGQVTLRDLLKMLPQFEVVSVWANDVLFRNKRA